VEELDRQEGTRLADCERLRTVIREVERRAAEEGLPKVAKICQIPEGPIWPAEARRLLAECVAATPF